MVAFAAGVTALLYEAGIRPQAAAGLSLGEYSALHAAEVFTVLMGEKVEPRKAFIEQNAKYAVNIDI